MTPFSLVDTARDMASMGRGRPRRTNLCRAVSTAYYAMFHCLAACCANTIVGGAGSDRSNPAWIQTYRALKHGTARDRARNRQYIAKFPPDIRSFADKFVEMQEKRHKADYDPTVNFPKLDVLSDIASVEEAIRRFNQSPIKDRRAFAVFVLLDLRNS